LIFFFSDMLQNLITACVLIFSLMAGWIVVQYLARAFAARHPELGPAREEGGGCGGLFCRCKTPAADCKRKQLVDAYNHLKQNHSSLTKNDSQIKE